MLIDKSNVDEAFEMLLEEIERVANMLDEAGKEAVFQGDYEATRRVIEEAIRFNAFRDKVRTLQEEWSTLVVGRVEPQQAMTPHPKGDRPRKGRRLAPGLRTREEAFRRPILEALVELGGSAPIGEVLKLVEHKVRDILNQYDYEPLPSDPNELRWRNTAQWCRRDLVREGLMKSDSPFGVWEISPEGRRALESMQHS